MRKKIGGNISVDQGQFKPAVPVRYPSLHIDENLHSSCADFNADGFASGGEGSELVRVRKKRRRAPRIVLAVLVVFLTAVVACGAALVIWVNSLDASMAFKDEGERARLVEALAPESTSEAEGSGFYVLLLGCDAREGDAVSRSDVTMLARIDPETGTVHLVSIPRDTMITLDGSTQKINAAYAFGGPAGAVEAVSEFAGVPIAHYVEVDFSELEQVVDALGGVWVNVPEAFSADDGGVSLQAGQQKLTGEQALAFARERYNVSGGDFGRAQAQRIIVQSIIRQVLECPPGQLPGVVGQLAGCVSTDYSIGDLVTLAQQFQDVKMSVYSAACPSYSFAQDGVSYVCPMFDEWRDMMRRVDAGLNPDGADEIPEQQVRNGKLGAASNSPAPRIYETLVANAALTTNDVVPEQ